jgi:hypothetical protein
MAVSNILPELGSHTKGPWPALYALVSVLADYEAR